jgi:DNA polymerase delta subunit 4
MPATRRANAKAGGPANRGGQKTLSFGSRSKVTKPAASTQSKSPPNDVAFLEDTSDVKSTTSSTDKPTTAAVESAIKDQVETETVRPRTEEEVQASRLKDSQIRKYWKAVEAERKAPRGIEIILLPLVVY